MKVGDRAADDGLLQLFCCLGIVGKHVFIEDVPKEEEQGTDVELERNALKRVFSADMGDN